MINVFAVIAVLPIGFMVAVLVNVPSVVIAKLLKLVKPLKEVLDGETIGETGAKVKLADVP